MMRSVRGRTGPFGPSAEAWRRTAGRGEGTPPA